MTSEDSTLPQARTGSGVGEREPNSATRCSNVSEDRAASPGKLIQLENVSKSYHRGTLEIPVLRGVSLTVHRGELVALIGTSGSGKSTLMNILGCLDRPTSGSYRFAGKEVASLSADDRAGLRNTKIGFVFQSFNLLPRTSALNNVRMPLDYSSVHPSDADSRNHSEQMLRLVGLAERMDHEPSALSGGQQQRVAIARALINRPQLLLADEPTGNLDSRTTEEVLRMFQELNEKEGLTIIIVTHDESVAHHAQRVIRMKDGVIVDEGPPSRPVPGGDVQSSKIRPPPGIPLHRNAGQLTQALRTVRMALRALRRNIMRTMLTCLGIVIGIAAVIAMMELGGGSSRSIEQAISSLGASMIQIDPASISMAGVSSGSGGKATLTMEDADALRNECGALQHVAPSVDCGGQAVYGNLNWRPGRILGSTPDYLEVRNWPVAQGDPFTMEDVRSSAAVCIIGQTVAERLFGTDSPMGKELRLRGVGLRVVGVLARKGANVMGQDQDDFLLAPLTTVKFRITGQRQATQPTAMTPSSALASTPSQTYPSQQPPLYPPPSSAQAANNPQLVRFTDLDDVWVAAGSPQNIPLAMRQIKSVLRDRHHIQPGAPDDFRIRDHTEIAQTFASTSRVMSKRRQGYTSE